MINLTESIKNALDDNNFGCGIFLDLPKAFDTCNHQILFNKLQHYGIRSKAIQWFKSYLSSRSQYVSVDGHSSSYLSVTCGVLQGSVLGPRLFLLYINDLSNSSNTLSFYLFADDKKFYFALNNVKQLQKVVNKELKHVKKWLDANKRVLTDDKTNLVIFHSPQNLLEESVTIKISKEHVKQTKYVKFLCHLLDESLN